MSATHKASRIPVAIRGQLFVFDRPSWRVWDAQTGNKLLQILVLMEAVVRPLLGVGARRLNIESRLWWQLLLMTLLLGMTCGLVAFFAKLPMSDFGFRSWRNWTKAERFYFVETSLLAIVIFSCINAASLGSLFSHPKLAQIGIFMFVPQIIWGIYQEFLYRGLLQSELVRRWGTFRGILVSNVLFTVGPLHEYHFMQAKGHPVHLLIFAAIFAIGLFFAILYRYSRNLWIVGLMHGLGDCFIDGLSGALRLAR